MSIINSFVAHCILAAAAVAFAATAQAAPVPVLSNLNSPASSEFGSLTVGRVNVALAQGFTSGSDVMFHELKTIRLDLAPDATIPTNDPVVQLWSSSGIGASALPSVKLADFTVAPSVKIAAGAAPAIYDFVGSYWMSANTNYWVVVRDASPTIGKFRWDYNLNGDTPVAVNSSGFSYIAAARSTNDGGSWARNTTANALSVELVAVPEPPTIILAGLGAAAAVGQGLRRRKMRQATEGGSESGDAEEAAAGLTA